MNGNDFMAWILRSPFHGLLSNDIMLLTITGRRSGKTYTTPVGYYVEGNYMWIITSRERIWWKNLQGGAKVDLLLKRKPVQGFADTELDEQAVQARMPEYLRHIPQAAKQMKVRIESGKPNPQDVANIAKDSLFVKIKLLE